MYVKFSVFVFSVHVADCAKGTVVSGPKTLREKRLQSETQKTANSDYYDFGFPFARL
jgi:hypothetical protein